MEKVYLVMPAYNEAENIEQTVAQWHPVAERLGGRLVIANDGSKDDTYAKLVELQARYPALVPIDKPNSGHGATVLHLYRLAIAEGADWIFQTDSDGQTDPEEFWQFWEARADHDALLGNREVRGDGKDRKFVENVVCLLLRLVFGVRVKDANAPFRLMRAEAVARHIGRMPADFNLPNIMLTTYFVRYGERVRFIPITFKPRQAGTNSINPRRIIKIGWRALGDFIALRRQMKG